MPSIGLINAPPRWLVAIAVMLTTVMVILDMTIVNVVMPHMMGALGATADQVTWVLTSYIVAEAIVIPMTGFLAARLGRRRLLLTAIGGFVLFSALCGQAGTLAEMVVFRLLQGAFGAVVIPISQAVLVDLFPGEERGKGMALWGIGVMMGPVLGPSLGGLITEYLDWRTVFYINLPVGLLNLLLVAMLIAPSEGRRQRIDWLGALAMAVGIGSLQLLLDRGNQENWWDSQLIIVLSFLAVVALAAFFWRGWRRDDSVVQLNLLRDPKRLAPKMLVEDRMRFGGMDVPKRIPRSKIHLSAPVVSARDLIKSATSAAAPAATCRGCAAAAWTTLPRPGLIRKIPPTKVGA